MVNRFILYIFHSNSLNPCWIDNERQWDNDEYLKNYLSRLMQLVSLLIMPTFFNLSPIEVKKITLFAPKKWYMYSKIKLNLNVFVHKSCVFNLAGVSAWRWPIRGMPGWSPDPSVGWHEYLPAPWWRAPVPAVPREGGLPAVGIHPGRQRRSAESCHLPAPCRKTRQWLPLHPGYFPTLEFRCSFRRQNCTTRPGWFGGPASRWWLYSLGHHHHRLLLRLHLWSKFHFFAAVAVPGNTK